MSRPPTTTSFWVVVVAAILFSSSLVQAFVPHHRSSSHTSFRRIKNQKPQLQRRRQPNKQPRTLLLLLQSQPTEEEEDAGVLNENQNEDDDNQDDAIGDMESILAALGGGNGFPASPFSTAASPPPSKSDVYSNDELLSLFNIHQELQTMQEEEEEDENNDQGFVPFADDTATTTTAATKMEEEEEEEESSILSLHEAVLQAMQLQQPEEEEESVAAAVEQPPQEEEEEDDTSWLDKDTKQRIANVRAVACDVDGTLIMSSSSSSSSLHPRTRVAVAECIRRSLDPDDPFVCFFPATGKSRTGALNSLDSYTREALQDMPGVFLQGLYCVDSQNNVVFEQTLPTETVRAAQGFFQEMLLLQQESESLSMVAYSGDELYTTQMTPLIRDLHQRYKEPLAQTVDDLTQLGEEEEDGGSEGGGVIHKILFLHHNPEWLKTVVRPLLEKLAAETESCVTQAIPTMLELLPPNGSKARGVAELCNRLLFAKEEDAKYSVSQNLLAIGDAENDVGMLQQASIGVAVGNASPLAQEAADFVMTETNNEGGAGAALQVFLFGT